MGNGEWDAKRIDELTKLLEVVKEQLKNIGGSFEADEAYFAIHWVLGEIGELENDK